MGDEGQISSNDQKLLSKLIKKGDSKEGGINLADLIMQKMEDGDYEDGDADKFDKQMANTVDLDTKIVDAYKRFKYL